jgi:putative addiction module killer protein
MNKYQISKTLEFDSWINSLSEKHRFQIRKRIKKIQDEGHFGDCKPLEGTAVWELKWPIGWRAYYVYFSKTHLLFLIGGNKNGQDKDIKKAQNILEKHLAKEGI